MMNNCNFAGRIIGEPKYFDTNGVPRVSFTMSVERDQKFEGENGSDYLDFIAWRSVAEFIHEYFHDGDFATISNARAQVRTYTDRSEVKHRKIEFLVDRIYFGQPKKSAE